MIRCRKKALSFGGLTKRLLPSASLLGVAMDDPSISEDGRILYVMVDNHSAVYADTSYQPECIIWLGALNGEEVYCNGQKYRVQLKVDEQHYLLAAEE